jgi:putative FmdB family regulatory protein
VPIYDYVCSACRHRFEVLRGLNEAGPGQCPLCEGPVTRAFAPPTIVFKGSGWAKVDRRSTGAPRKKPSGSEGSGGGSGSEGSGGGSGSGGAGDTGGGHDSRSSGGAGDTGGGHDSRPSRSGGSSEPAAAPSTRRDD